MYSGSTYSTADPPVDEAVIEINEVAEDDDVADEVEVTVNDEENDAPTGVADGDEVNPLLDDPAEEITADDVDEAVEDQGPIDTDDQDMELEKEIIIEDGTGGPSTRTRSNNADTPFYKLDDKNQATVSAQVRRRRDAWDCYEVDWDVGECYMQFVNEKTRGIAYAQLALDQVLSSFSTPEEAFFFN